MAEVIIGILSSGLVSGTLVALINAISNRGQQKRQLAYQKELNTETQTKISAEIEDLKKDVALSKEAQKSSLYFSIKSGCLDAINKGSIDSDSLEAITQAWEIYHTQLGGNGFLDTLMSQVRSLKIKN